MLRNAWLILVVAGFCSPTFPSSCKQPTTECLQQHIQSQAEHLQQQGLVLSPIATQHWQFELRSGNATEGSSELQKQLLAEEAFLQLIRQGNLEVARTKSKAMPLPFHDLLQARAVHLIIQQFSLNLEDTQAEEVKREQLEANWQQDKTPNQELIEIARHEILGGNPKRGLATLSNIEIDNFSEIDLVNEQTNIQRLGETAETLFLDPTAAKKRCDQDSDAALASLNDFFSPQHLTSTKLLWSTPNTLQAWKAHLTLVILYRNAGACELLVSLQLHQLVNSAMDYQIKTEQDFLDLVFLLRALRRYHSKPSV